MNQHFPADQNDGPVLYLVCIGAGIGILLMLLVMMLFSVGRVIAKPLLVSSPKEE